jgi:hypothetical protein
LKALVSVKLQFEMVKVNQQYETLALIISAALGGKEPEKAPEVKSYDELAAMISAMGGTVASG